MSRKLLLISTVFCLGIIVCLTLFVYKPRGTGNTIQEAITKSGRIPLKIISEENVKGGVIVFYIKNSLELKKAQLACGFVKETPWGWKWVYGGEHVSIESSCYKDGFSNQFFPNAEGTPFPLYFGAITNPNINQINVIEKKRNVEGKATIVNNDYVKIWYIYMDKFQGSKFDIIGLSSDGKEIEKSEQDVSPYMQNKSP